MPSQPTYTDPEDWVDGLVVGQTFAHRNLRDNIRYLYSRYHLPQTVDIVGSTGGVALAQTIAAGELGTNRMLRCTLLGDLLNNTGENRNLAVAVLLAGTELWRDSRGVGFAATRQAVRLVCELGMGNAANVEFLAGVLDISTSTENPPVGIGGGSWTNYVFASNGSASFDTSVPQVFSINVAMGVASSQFSFRRKYALVEII